MTQHPAAMNGQPISDEVAFDRARLPLLWEEHRRWIAAVLLAYKPRRADLEDLLQEVAMTLVSKIHTLRDESNLKAWLRTIAINVARAAARTERARPVLDSASLETWAAFNNDDPLIERHEHSHRMLELVAQLPEAYREPLMLKAVRNMRTRQIAEILEIEEATVDTRISRARRMLREQIEPNSQFRIAT